MKNIEIHLSPVIALFNLTIVFHKADLRFEFYKDGTTFCRDVFHHTHTHTHTHTHPHTHTHARTHTRTHARTHARMRAHTQRYTNIQRHTHWIQGGLFLTTAKPDIKAWAWAQDVQFRTAGGVPGGGGGGGRRKWQRFWHRHGLC